MNAALTAWSAYARELLPHRLHVVLRALTCPFAAVLDRFPCQGAVLDVGCGHGLLINLLARDPAHAGLQLTGIDHDAAKIAVARRNAPPTVDFSTRSLEDFPDGRFDAVSIFDVLYTVQLGVWADILQGCRRVLRPGGLLIVKEVVDRPRWKHGVIMAQESLSVRIFRITKGDSPHFESPDGYCRAIAGAGFERVESAPLPSVSWISHHLFTAVKPA